MQEPKDRQILTEKHSFVNDAIFRAKVMALTTKRIIKNALHPVKRFTNLGELNDKKVISFSESNLWNPDDNKDNWALTAGKIENLRIACQKLNGVEIKPNETFSFWKHIGNPNIGKGYVVGREIREGCIIPTKAGGLCQLSNALYDAALKAHFEILERHRHTRVVRGSLAEHDKDATVKWNYVDLRFRSNYAFKIRAELTTDKLIVSLHSERMNDREIIPSIASRPDHQLNDCYSCGNFACFKHPDRTSAKREIGITTYILDECWDEYNAYIAEKGTETDYTLLPLRKNRLIDTTRYRWKVHNLKRIRVVAQAGVRRALQLRWAAKRGKNLFELSLQTDRAIAHAAAKKIPIECTHLVIQQNLLPFLYECGALGGRTYDVFMTRLPAEKLQGKLDAAFEKYPDSPTLRDYRASKEFIALENKALTQARNIITPHYEIATLFNHKCILLPWATASDTIVAPMGNTILLPASAVGRKGAYELKQLAKEMGYSIAVAGNAIEYPGFWEDIPVTRFNGDFSQIGLVVYPAYVEHRPRLLLKALAKGIPAVVTSACGVLPATNVHIVPTGNYPALKKAVESVMKAEEISL